MWKDWKRAPCITAAYFISLRVVYNLCVCVWEGRGHFTSSSRVYTRWYSCSRSITYVVAWWRKKGRLSKESGTFTIKLKNLNLPVSMLFNLPRFWNWNFGLIMGFFFSFKWYICQEASAQFLFPFPFSILRGHCTSGT